jgi:hypothetical protein
MTPTEKLISRLDKVIPRGKNGYLARCPAHDDNSPSLSVTEASDGRVLVNCFAGCSALGVVESVGLTLADLYPPENEGYQINQKPIFRTKEKQITYDECVLALSKDLRKQGKKLTTKELDLERQAFMRLKAGKK